MIALLGFKRIVILGVVVGVNVLLGAAIYLYLIPQIDNVDRQIRSANSRMSTMQSEIQTLTTEFDQIQGRQDIFELLRQDDFFSDQNRSGVENLLKQIEQESGVLSAKVAFRSGQTNSNYEVATEAEHVILESPVEINLSAMNDTHIYRYLYLLERMFPGHISINNIVIQRIGEINSTVLRAIVDGKNPPLIRAQVSLIWRTLIPQSEKIEKAR